MSYEIFYSRAFVRMDDRYIPMVCYGSNNTFEFEGGRELPERNWHILNFGHENQILFTKEEIEQLAAHYEQISQSSGTIFKSRHQAFGPGEFHRWVVNGMRTARTLEEYSKAGNKLYLVALNHKKRELVPYEKQVASDDSFRQALQEARSQGCNHFDLQVRPNRNFQYPNLPQMPIKVPDEYFVLAAELGGTRVFFTKLLRRGYLYTHLPEPGLARIFETESKALQYRQKYAHRWGSFEFTPEKITARKQP